MKKLKEYIDESFKKKTVIGHFNISNLEALWAVFHVARKLEVPVIVGNTEHERKFMGMRQAVALVRSLREEFDFPIYLNADHCRSFESIRAAVDAGYDAVLFDPGGLGHEENIEVTRKCREYAKGVNPDIVFEGEIGNLEEAHGIWDYIPESIDLSPEMLTKPEEAAEFVKETGVDVLAPSVGNIHGILKYGENPPLDIDRIKSIREATGIPLSLHGGSGISDRDIQRALFSGVAIVHITTDVRVAYRNALRDFLESNPDEIAPYKISENAVFEMEKIVETKLKVFTKTGV